MGGAVAESHEVKQFLGAILGLPLRCSSDVGGNHDVFYRRELRQ